MIETVLFTFLLAKIKGYKLKEILKDWVVYPVLFFAAVYVVAEISIFFDNYFLVPYTQIYKVAYILSFIPMVVKYRLAVVTGIGLLFMIAGNILNKIVMNANGGKMPVYPSLSYATGYADTYIDQYHMWGDSTVKLKILSDFIDLGYTVMSLGDIFVRIFVFLILFYSIKYTSSKTS
jgi:hypothetical protein